MKNLKVLGIAVLVLLTAFSLIGCKDPDSDPESMTFEDTNKEFTINENFEFKVTFKNNYMVFQAGQKVSGEIINRNSNNWKNDFTGTAHSMSSDNSMVNSLLGSMDLKISLDYDTNTVTVSFPDASQDPSNPNTQAQAMMGGTYTKKN